MAALDVKGTLQNARTMLSGLTAWQSICGVATAAEAAERIIYGGFDDTDEDAALTPPYCILDIETFESNWQGGRFQPVLPITLRFELAVDPEHTATWQDQYLWVWEKFSDIINGIQSNVQGGGQLMAEELNLLLRPGLIDPDTNNGRCDWLFIIQIGNHLK